MRYRLVLLGFVFFSLMNVLADDQIDISSGNSQDTVIIEQMPVEEIVVPVTEYIAGDSVPSNILSSDLQIPDTPVQEEQREEVVVPIETPLSKTPSDMRDEISLVVSDTEQRIVSVDGNIVTIMWK